MLTVLGKEIDFDVTSPADMQRYLDAEAAMQKAAAALPPDPDPAAMATREGLQEYQAHLAVQCKLLTDFIDAAFGDGTCNALLGPKTSLSTLLDVMDALRDAISNQGTQYAQRLAAYKPNRATRRKAAK
ncbi:MAG: hypothetical protein DBX91_08425 [Subdoligranulum variabile]|nr:MAG: hypothetical protein DBX91_08425 [Subdoligranulum variabile]